MHNYIRTFTGRKFYPLDPRVEDVHIEDIAHALANKCRFTGHTREFYSVAQHSVLVSQHCEDNRWGLMHDAGEAYLPDVATPVKSQLIGFKDIEDKVLQVIAAVFGLSWPMPAQVKAIDLDMLVVEKRDLMKSVTLPMVTYDYITPWQPALAKETFLHTFNNLFNEVRV